MDRTENDATNNSSLPRERLYGVVIYKDGYKHRPTDTCPTILVLLLIFVSAGTCSSSRCLAMKGGIQYTKPLLSNDRRDTHTDTQTGGRGLWSTPLSWAKVPWYCTVLAVLVRDDRLSHLIVHTFYSRLHRRYYNCSVTTSSYTNGVDYCTSCWLPCTTQIPALSWRLAADSRTVGLTASRRLSSSNSS
jgi:hypothetical protein